MSRLLSFDDLELIFSWDDVVERDINVQVPVTGAPADGYVVKGRATASPDTLRARGPSQIVDNLQLARVEAFDINGLKEGIHRRTLVIDRAPLLQFSNKVLKDFSFFSRFQV